MIEQFLGWYQEHLLFCSLLILMAIDIAAGFLVAYRLKSINSSITFRGNTKKAGVLLLIVVGMVLESVLQSLTGKTPPPVSDWTTGFFIGWEMTSVIENCASLGLPIPNALREALAKLRKLTSEPIFKVRLDSEDPLPVKPVEPVQVTTDPEKPVDVKPVPSPSGGRRITD